MLQFHWLQCGSLRVRLLAGDRLGSVMKRPKASDLLAINREAHEIARPPMKGNGRLDAAFGGRTEANAVHRPLSGNDVFAFGDFKGYELSGNDEANFPMIDPQVAEP